MKENRGTFNCIQNSITKGQTILCIGCQQEAHLFLLRKVAGSLGKLILFAPKTIACDHLQQLIQRMEWMNIVIEPLQLPDNSINAHSPKRDITKGAAVIYINERKSYKESVHALDDYCACQNIKPDFIKINLSRNQLEVLQGAAAVLKKYKPKVMIECEERLAGRRNIIATFEFLKLLDYKGFFILDTIRVPLQNLILIFTKIQELIFIVIPSFLSKVSVGQFILL
jgi:FkbM family methyltransferase